MLQILKGRWAPITQDFGLIKASMTSVVDALVKWHSGIGITYERKDVRSSVDAALDSLPPLAASKGRRLFVSTKSDWVACFQNGIQGSDPFPAMSTLAGKLDTLSMRVFAGTAGAAWEVYASPNHGGDPHAYRRSVYALIEDSGKWEFGESGVPFPFEAVEQYKARLKRERFNPPTLDSYLRHFGIELFRDDFYLVDKNHTAVLLQQKNIPRPTQYFSVQEVVDAKPWHRG